MAEQVGNKQVIQGEDIIVTVDGKPTLHATSHTLKVDLEVKDVRTKDTNGKEKYPGDISWSVDVEGLVVIDADLASSHDKPEDILQTILSKAMWVLSSRPTSQGLLQRTTAETDTSHPSRWVLRLATTPPTTLASPEAEISIRSILHSACAIHSS